MSHETRTHELEVTGAPWMARFPVSHTVSLKPRGNMLRQDAETRRGEEATEMELRVARSSGRNKGNAPNCNSDVEKLPAGGTWMYRNGAPWVSQKPKGKHNEPRMVKLRRGSGRKKISATPAELNAETRRGEEATKTESGVARGPGSKQGARRNQKERNPNEPSQVNCSLPMGSAYTPGLTVSGDIVVKRIRRLPIKGEVMVKDGDRVHPDTVVARALLPGPLQTMKLAEELGVEARDAPTFITLKVGDTVEKGQVVAMSKGFLGMGKKEVAAKFTGTIESISEVTGNILVREASIPVDVTAYIEGFIADVIPHEGAVVETRAAMVQGIFGVGGERVGTIRVAVSGPREVLDASSIKDDDKGKILVGGSLVSYEALVRGSAVGVTGFIAGGVKDGDLTKFLGYDIGVAITGQEAINLTLMVTEGFGSLNMADRTFALLQSLEGKSASINGATQIRAGVIRPEIIVPLALDVIVDKEPDLSAFELRPGASIRVIREPYFGFLATVVDLPAQLMVVDSGTEVRVLKARLEDGSEVLVPRANVEIIAT